MLGYTLGYTILYQKKNKKRGTITGCSVTLRSENGTEKVTLRSEAVSNSIINSKGYKRNFPYIITIIDIMVKNFFKKQKSFFGNFKKFFQKFEFLYLGDSLLQNISILTCKASFARLMSLSLRELKLSQLREPL